MKIKVKAPLKLLMLFVAMTFLVTGCRSGTKPVAWNVSITKTTPASIEVDFIGVSPSEKPYWMNDVKPDDYWKPNDSIRQGARKLTINFQSGTTFVLQRKDPIWNDWLNYGATELMVMADLPGTYDNSPYDRRRLFLPLNTKTWKSKNKTLEIQIQDEFIRVLTPQRSQN
jgi:hypothetical protein